MKSMEVMHMIDKDNVMRERCLNFQERFFDRMDQGHDGKVDADEWMGRAGTGTGSK